jgi:hypothetical protein
MMIIIIIIIIIIITSKSISLPENYLCHKNYCNYVCYVMITLTFKIEV